MMQTWRTLSVQLGTLFHLPHTHTHPHIQAHTKLEHNHLYWPSVTDLSMYVCVSCVTCVKPPVSLRAVTMEDKPRDKLDYSVHVCVYVPVYVCVCVCRCMCVHREADTPMCVETDIATAGLHQPTVATGGQAWWCVATRGQAWWRVAWIRLNQELQCVPGRSLVPEHEAD